MSGSIHEDYTRSRHADTSSDRQFGVIFGAALVLISVWPLWRGAPVRSYLLALAICFFVLAIARPAILHPLNRVWTALGILLGRLTTPIVVAVMFYLVITPMAVVSRAIGRDFLRLKRDRNALSYWIPRVPPGPAPATMNRQY